MKTTKTKQKVHPAAIEFITSITWEFTRKNLYGGFTFSAIEVMVAKHHIRNYYRDILPELFQEYAQDYLNQFCERVLLAKKFVQRKPNRFVTNPSLWLNPDNANGFAGTKKWWKENQSNIVSLRFFHKDNRVFVIRDESNSSFRQTA